MKRTIATAMVMSAMLSSNALAQEPPATSAPPPTPTFPTPTDLKPIETDLKTIKKKLEEIDNQSKIAEVSETLTELKTQVEEAEEKDDELRQKLKELQDERAQDLRLFGIGFGGSATLIYVPAEEDGSGDDAVEESPQSLSAHFMPYVSFTPEYWGGRNPQQDLYCSKRYFGVDVADAQKAAGELAKKQSAEKLALLINNARTGTPISISFDNPADLRALEALLVKIVAAEQESDEYERLVLSAWELVARSNHFDFNLGEPVGCPWSYYLGFAVGFPVGSVTIEREAASEMETATEEELSPLAALGLVFSPNYNVNIMVGATVLREKGGPGLRPGFFASLGLQAELLDILPFK